MTSNEENPLEPKPIAEEELQLRKRQIWLVAGIMVLTFCLLAFLLFVVGGLIFGADIRQLVRAWMNP